MKTTKISIISLALAILLSPLNAAAQESTHVIISGTLVDDIDTPYAFNPITLTTDSGQTLDGQTDYQGNFRLEGQLTENSGTLTLYTTYGRSIIATLPIIWSESTASATIDLGTAAVSQTEHRFLINATELFSPTESTDPANSDGIDNPLFTEPETNPAAVTPIPLGQTGAEGSAGNSDSAMESSESTPMVSPAEVALPGQNPRSATMSETPDDTTSKRTINPTRAKVVLAVLVIIGLGLIGGGVVAVRKRENRSQHKEAEKPQQ